jgi:hypothetical protein
MLWGATSARSTRATLEIGGAYLVLGLVDLRKDADNPGRWRRPDGSRRPQGVRRISKDDVKNAPITMPRLTVTVDRIIFGAARSPDMRNANLSPDDPEPEWARQPTHILLGQIRFGWITRIDVELSYATGWSRKLLRTRHGRPENRLLRVGLQNGWDAVLVSFRLPTDPACFKDGNAQKYDEQLEYNLDQRIRHIANHRLTSHPRHQRDIDSLHALTRQGLQLPPNGTTSGKIAKRSTHHDIPAAEMISLPPPDTPIFPRSNPPHT